jgi:ribosomal protein L15
MFDEGDGSFAKWLDRDCCPKCKSGPLKGAEGVRKCGSCGLTIGGANGQGRGSEGRYKRRGGTWRELWRRAGEPSANSGMPTRGRVYEETQTVVCSACRKPLLEIDSDPQHFIVLEEDLD